MIAVEALLPKSLRTRFLLIAGILLTLVLALAIYTARWYTQEVVGTTGRHYAERNAAYEKSRLVQVLARELSLAQKMASSPVLKDWIAAESEPARRARAIAELEDYRTFFRSHSYFFAVAQSGNYYYADDQGGHALEQPRYTLSRSIAKDTWFYATLDAADDQLLNVDTDRHLGVTKVWVNTLVRDAQGRGIAVTGTGVELSEFIASVVASERQGERNLLIDAQGAIQASPDTAMIDYASIRKERAREEQSTVYSLLESPAERTQLKTLLARLQDGSLDSGALSVHVAGREQMLGATYVPEIRWFVISLIDPTMGVDGEVLPYGVFVILGSLVAALALLAYVLDRQVVARLAHLNRFAERVGGGDYAVAIPDSSPDEIGRLSRTMQAMGRKIAEHTETLEMTVAQRTIELERIARTDYPTGLLNRRGMAERLHIEQQRLARKGGLLGLLLLDIDWFKQVNDRLGHEAGDRVISRVAEVIAANVRAYDLCARWGGEEFLVAIPEVSDPAEIRRIAEKLLREIRALVVELPRSSGTADSSSVSVTASIGVGVGAGVEPLDALILRADRSLYNAKDAGRDRVGEFVDDRVGSQ